MSGHHEPLCRISIPKARQQILKTIADYRVMAALSSNVERFILSMHGKTVNRSIAGKLQEFLVREMPNSKIGPVYYYSGRDAQGYPEFKLEVTVYELDEPKTTFYVRYQRENGGFDLDSMMVGHRLWTRHANHLQEQLEVFNLNAKRFNDLVGNLRDFAKVCVPSGELHAVYPLTEYFHYYQLTNPSVSDS